MYQLCHRRYNEKDVVELTIEAYTNKLRNKKVNLCIYYDSYVSCSMYILGIRMFNENLNCLKKAWMLARGKFKNHGKIKLIVAF